MEIPMKIKGQTIRFEAEDMAFVKQFGVFGAAERVWAHRAVSPLPFLYDSYQLAAFFAAGRKTLFDCARHPEREYRITAIPKRHGGVRQLAVPSRQLRYMQVRILRWILEKEPVSSYAAAYVKDRGLRENAAPHVGKRYLLKLDIRDFFGSIRFAQVQSAAFSQPHFPTQTGALLTALCCCRGVLPQGAPTSPALSNLVMRPFDDAMGSWCAARGIAYTRYCDDMAFSADIPLYGAYQTAKTMLRSMGFSLNEEKTRFVTHAGRQSVTGLTVNEKISVNRGYKRRLRQEVHYVLRFGLAEQILHRGLTKFLMGGLPNPETYYRSLLGRVQYVLQMEPENTWFQNARTELQASKLLKGEMILWKR
jgi:RNA-directed DNA polymerase